MLIATAQLIGMSPISFNRPIQSSRDTGESHEALDARTWKERLHVDPKGNVFIPPTALKNCLVDIAKYLGESVPGKGRSTFTKHFEAGIMVTDPLFLSINALDVEPERVFVPSDGRRGGTTRVWKTFPFIPEWNATATIQLLDPILIDKPEKIHEYLVAAGTYIGLGRFRPRNNGYYGRFRVEKFAAKKPRARK